MSRLSKVHQDSPSPPLLSSGGRLLANREMVEPVSLFNRRPVWARTGSDQKLEIDLVIAAHNHLRWPDLSREWIRRQQARIARVDWELRLPVVLGPCKSRLSLFTRKQQKLLNKAREMEGVLDLSALLKGKLQMLSTKSSSAGIRPSPVEGDENVEPSAQNPTKKAAGKTKKCIAEGEQSASLEDSVPLEEALSSADASMVSKKKKKKKDGKKRPREDLSIDQNEGLIVIQEDNTGGPAQTGSTEASPEERPKKRAKKKSVEDGARRSIDGDHPDDLPASEDPSRSGGKASGSKGDPRSESPSSERAKIILAFVIVQSDGSMNYLVEKYDSALKQTMIQLDAAEKLAWTKLSAIERLRAENKKANDKAAEEKEVLRSPEKENLETGDILIQEGGTENVGPEDHVLVSDTSSERREDEEGESDRGEKTPSLRPNEEEVTSEVGKGSTLSIPSLGVDLPGLVPAQGPTVSAAEDPQDPPAPSVLTGNGNDQDSAA
ncbi:LOW QUALITY PROTEIN: hypothetical protein HID58_081519 [Brassica napus]|uniref:Uncharacterized protein n=1 Tax=Brassica napus TaxID=3708 RepID=A0ABQ7Y7Y0_BRANA|nr:LOW QUALITY PROTEIN: hypothetical protein HID58_081519 [Brassica napus]